MKTKSSALQPRGADTAVPRKGRSFPIGLVWLQLCAVFMPAPARADDAAWAQLQRGGYVILIRHAITTPGVGDPPGFKLEDCSTQRNLTDDGRAHARRVGAAIRARKIAVERVVSSPWCRCIETARLAFETSPEMSAPLANQFGRPDQRDAQVAELRKAVGAFRGRGNLVMVTHGSTISALTGVSPATAEMVLIKPAADGTFAVTGRLAVP
jgi:phosphohistidine phosphatase SixA